MSRTRSPSNGSAGEAVVVRVRWRDSRRRVELIECSPRRGARSGGRSRADPSRKGGRGFAEAIPRVRGERPPCLEVVERRDVRAVRDRCVGDPEGRRQTDHLFDGVIGDPLVDGRSQRRSVQEQLRILHPLGMSDHGAEVQPLLAGATPEPDQPVACRPDARRRDEPPSPHRSSELVVERHRVVGEAHHERLEHRHVDELALRVGAPNAPPGCRSRRRAPESHSPIWPPTNTGARSGRPDRARRSLPTTLAA